MCLGHGFGWFFESTIRSTVLRVNKKPGRPSSFNWKPALAFFELLKISPDMLYGT